MTRDFSILRADWLAASRGPLPRYEHIQDARTAAYFSPDAPPRTVLFISHRWESPDQPDPAGRQADAIRAFLTNLTAIHCAAHDSAAAGAAPSLLRNGWVQAAHFYDTCTRFGGPPSWDQPAERFASAEEMLAQVGVWYDYSSMPQDGASARLVESLSRIHTLIEASRALILRYPGDDYERRAWCALEVRSTEAHVSRPHPGRPLVLRLDRADEVIDTSAFADMAKVHDWPAEPGAVLNRITEMFSRELFKLEDEDTGDLINTYTTRRSRNLFVGNGEMLMAEIQLMGSISNADKKLGRVGYDMRDVIKITMQKSGLQTSKEQDLLYTGLMLLYLSRRLSPEHGVFYQTAVQRLLAGKNLQLARYRELRPPSPLDYKCWFVFAGEPVGAIPGWVKRDC